MKNYLYFLSLIALFFSGNFYTFSQSKENDTQLKKSENIGSRFLSENENNFKTNENLEFLQYSKRCSTDLVSQRIYQEYGSVFSANLEKVKLPKGCFFQSDREVRQFQDRTESAETIINGIKIELQSEALKAYLAARAEAKKAGLDITPRFTDSSRRSFADTLELWREQVSDGLVYWVKKGRFTNKEASLIRSLSINKQVIEILKLEENKVYFGDGYQKSILQSVATPGGSQHNFMLALDINQFDNQKVRTILAKYGWFQTVKNDDPHFTFLGLKESQLPDFGLKRSTVGRRVIWTVKTQIPLTASAANNSKDAETNSNGVTRIRIVRNKGEEDKKPKENSLVKRTTLLLPTKNIPATASEDVILPLTLEPLLSELAQKYYAIAGKMLHITSGFRTPERQAQAMHFNLSKYGIQYVASTYGGRPAVWEIIKAFQDNHNDKEKAILEIAKIIKSQIKRGVVISPHIGEKAFDIRSWGEGAANLTILRKVTQSMHGEVVVEKDHYHVQF